jgi:hypothetical protein
VVVLYVYTIQQRNAAQDKYRKYFDAAARCQRQISSMAENESLAQRYTVVLEERKRAPFPKFSVETWCFIFRACGTSVFITITIDLGFV